MQFFTFHDGVWLGCGKGTRVAIHASYVTAANNLVNNAVDSCVRRAQGFREATRCKNF